MQLVFTAVAIGVIIGVYLSFRQMNKKIKSEMLLFEDFKKNQRKREDIKSWNFKAK